MAGITSQAKAIIEEVVAELFGPGSKNSPQVVEDIINCPI
jgi:hypothetical protein